MKKILKRTGIAMLFIVLGVVIAFITLFRNEIRSLTTLKRTDEYGMFQMTYYGDYGFDEFLKTGAENDAEIEAFVTRRLLKGLPVDLGVAGSGCTAFVVKNEKGEILFGRNFDYSYAPSLQLYTNPDNGYASVSTVNLSFAGYSKDHLPKGLSIDSFLTLAGPFLPFDGMNEKGVAIALLAVPETQIENDDSKVTLNTTTAIRLVLDKAATVREAVELLRQYNIYFSDDTYCHYLIADAAGNSVIVEYIDNGLKVVETDADYQIASNFIAYNGLNIGEGYDEFERYNTVKTVIESNLGTLTREQSIALLAQVGIQDGNIDKLQWSVLYNLTAKNGDFFAHRNTENLLSFCIEE